MAGCGKGQPRHQGSIFHGVPGPKSAKTQGLVGPSASHENADSQYGNPRKGPRKRRFHPVRIPTVQQPGNGIGKGNQGQGKAQKQGRGVDGHPPILKQRVQSVSFLEGWECCEVVRHLRPRQAQVLRQVADQNKGTGANLQVAHEYPEQHGRQKGLHRSNGQQDAAFPFLCGSDQNPSQKGLPESPKQEAAFLAFPETREDVAHGQIRGTVAPDVVKFKPVVPKHPKQNGHNAQDRNSVQTEAPPGSGQPRTVGFANMQRIRPSRKQGKDKGQRHKEPAQIAGPGMFSYVTHDCCSFSFSWYLDGHFIKIFVVKKAVSVANPVMVISSDRSKSVGLGLL